MDGRLALVAFKESYLSHGCQANPVCSVPTSFPSDQAPTPNLGLRGLHHPMSSSASHLDGALHRVSPPVPWDKPEEGPWARPSVNHFTHVVAFDLHSKPGRRVLILVSLCRAANGGQKDQATCQESHSNMTAESEEAKEGVLSTWGSQPLAPPGPKGHLQQVGTLGCPSVSNSWGAPSGH